MHASDPRYAALVQAAKEAGGKDIARVVASAELAVTKGQPIDEVIALLVKNQSRLFYPVRPPLERKDTQRKQKAARRASHDDE